MRDYWELWIAIGIIIAFGVAINAFAFDTHQEDCLSTVQGRCIQLNEQEHTNPCGRKE